MIAQINTFNDDWLQMRHSLWSDATLEEHREEIEELLADANNCAQFMAYSRADLAVGFAEASIRHEYVNGTNSSPVAYLEGVYVKPSARQSGVGAALIKAVAAWGLAHGCSELASDVPIDNLVSQNVHLALGFAATERVVFFVRSLSTRQNSKHESVFVFLK
jgi:aminoglycoside 6'-N-acetyltransferase I